MTPLLLLPQRQTSRTRLLRREIPTTSMPASPMRSEGARSRRGVKNWDDAVGAALEEALAIFPHCGTATRPFLLDGKPAGRSNMISEYIRRRTGEVREPRLVNLRLSGIMSVRAATEPRIARILTENKYDPKRDSGRDWVALLGPDLYPHTKADAEAATEASRMRIRKLPSSRKRRARPNEGDVKPNKPSTCPSPPSHLSATPSNGLKPSSAFPSAVFPSAVFPPADSLPSSALPASLQFLLYEDVNLSATHLQALLTAVFPDHDFSSSAKLLYAVGLDSITALTDFIAADDHFADVLIEKAVGRAKLRGTEAGWARKALLRLSSSFRSEAIA
ncbi:hypothetical protein JCM8097_003767 [Rhodosporidiobolus ruineniae]